jgi:hypothetical protein
MNEELAGLDFAVVAAAVDGDADASSHGFTSGIEATWP